MENNVIEDKEQRLTITEMKILKKDSDILLNTSKIGCMCIGLQILVDLVCARFIYDGSIPARIILIILSILSMSLTGFTCEFIRDALICREDINDMINKEIDLREQEEINLKK